MSVPVILFIFASFFKDFRPSDPYFSPIMDGPKNFTREQIKDEIIPYGTYTNMIFLLAILFLIDYLKYKPIILFHTVSSMLSAGLFILGTTIVTMEVAQTFYGLLCACDVAYSSYLFATVSKSQYLTTTSHAKAASLVAKAASGFIAELLLIYNIIGISDLLYGTLAAAILNFIITMVLAFHSCDWKGDRPIPEDADKLNETPEEKVFIENPESEDTSTPSGSVVSGSPSGGEEKKTLQKMTDLFAVSTWNHQVLKWSVWYIAAQWGHLQVLSYAQLLWQDTADNAETPETLYNGFCHSSNALIGALSTVGAAYLNLDWTEIGDPVLALISLLQGGLILYSSYLSHNIYLHYIIFGLFKVLFHVEIIIIPAELAKEIKSEQYGLIFGINQFIALFLQSITTFLITKVLSLDVRQIFFFYGLYYFVVAALLIIHFVVFFCISKKRS